MTTLQLSFIKLSSLGIQEMGIPESIIHAVEQLPQGESFKSTRFFFFAKMTLLILHHGDSMGRVVRASDLKSGGRGFKSLHSDH